MAPAFAAAISLLAGATAWAQDTRHVVEPRTPDACLILRAAIPATAGALAETSEHENDSARIQSAIDGCPPGHAVELRADGERTAFLSGPLTLRRGVTLLVDDNVTLFASRNPRDYDVGPASCGVVDDRGGGCRPFIQIAGNDAAVMGRGTIDGRGGATLVGSGKSWWDLAEDARPGNRHQNCPRLIVADHVNNFTLYRITLKNSPNFHVVFSGGDGFTAWGVIIDTPKTARNTDGIDPISASNVTIVHCYIHTGDDHVAVKAGSGGPAAHITVAHNHFYTGHGMSIGSETDGGVRAMQVTDLTIEGADNGLRIKSNDSRGGHVDDITYSDVCIRATKNPIVLQTSYTPSDPSEHGKVPVYAGIVFRHVHIDGPGAITLEGHDASHPLHLSFEGVQIGQDVTTHKQHADLVMSNPAPGVTCADRYPPMPQGATMEERRPQPVHVRADPPSRDPQRPALFIVGDSTANNNGPGVGWGDRVGSFFDESGLQVLNWAHSGRSSRSYREEGRWQRVLGQLQPGDVVIVQFGHNDQKEITSDRGTIPAIDDETRTVVNADTGSPALVHSYGWYLRQYVAEARARGAVVMFAAPVPRNYWKAGAFDNAMRTHSEMMARVAETTEAPFLDVNRILAAEFMDLGQEFVTTRYFTVGDSTHTNVAGARLNASAVVEALRGLSDSPLARFLKPAS